MSIVHQVSTDSLTDTDTMLKLLYSYTVTDTDLIGVQLFQTAHNGPDYHTRYGLEVKAFYTRDDAIADMKTAIGHLCDCEQIEYAPCRFVDHTR